MNSQGMLAEEKSPIISQDKVDNEQKDEDIEINDFNPLDDENAQVCLTPSFIFHLNSYFIDLDIDEFGAKIKEKESTQNSQDVEMVPKPIADSHNLSDFIKNNNFSYQSSMEEEMESENSLFQATIGLVIKLKQKFGKMLITNKNQQ